MTARWRYFLLIAIGTITLAGCTTTNSVDPSRTPTPSVATAAPGESNAQTTRTTALAYRLECFFPDGTSAGSFSSLNETWASTNFVRMDYCTASFHNAPPSSITHDDVSPEVYEAISTAASELPSERTMAQVFLDIYAACARVSPGDGPHGVASHQIPVLRATLKVCPKAPGAGIVRQYVKEQE